MSRDFSFSKAVLVVDDHDVLRRMLCDFLKSLGLQVFEASSAAEAIQLAHSHLGSIDVLLTDLEMPGMSGWELAEKIGGLEPGIRILYMSGGISIQDWKRYAQKPAGTYFIQKPFQLEELRILLKVVLSE